MTRRQQTAIDGAHDRRYFTIMPNLADDSDLDPYEFRLLAHYRRVAGDGGECREFTRTTAERCKMSRRHLFDARNALETKGWIVIEHRGGRGANLVHVVLVDRWPENMARYAPMHEVHGGHAPGAAPPMHTVHGDMHDVPTEEEPSKKTIEEDPSSDEEGERAARAKPRGRGKADRYDQLCSLVHSWQGADFPIYGGERKNREYVNTNDRPVDYLARAYIRLVLGWWVDDWASRTRTVWQTVECLASYDDQREDIERQIAEQATRDAA